MASRTSFVSDRRGGSNRIIEFWKDGHNLGVLSTTDNGFAEKLKRWARAKGIETRESGKK